MSVISILLKSVVHSLLEIMISLYDGNNCKEMFQFIFNGNHILSILLQCLAPNSHKEVYTTNFEKINMYLVLYNYYYFLSSHMK